MSIAMPGFVDRHAHLLRVASGATPRWMSEDVGAYHLELARAGLTPMDEPAEPRPGGLPRRLLLALAKARSFGLVELWEAGVAEWGFLDALTALRDRGPLPVRVRLLVASGLAERGMPDRTHDPWVDIVGVKFYLDGWLGSRTCAMSHPFADSPGTGILFQDADALASRIEPFASDGWLIATHAIGDRAIETAVDAYEMVYGSDIAQSGCRIEHAQILRTDLIDRIARLGITVCIQPGFAASDAPHAERALKGRFPMAYNWRALALAGVPLVSGSDFPIESLDPLVGFKSLTTGVSALDPRNALDIMTDEEAGVTLMSTNPLSDPAASVLGAVVHTNRRGAGGQSA